MRNDMLITDLPARIAGGFTPSRGVGEGWIPVTWETADCQGVGLAAGAGSGARELTLDLGLSGRHILHLALRISDQSYHVFRSKVSTRFGGMFPAISV